MRPALIAAPPASMTYLTLIAKVRQKAAN